MFALPTVQNYKNVNLSQNHKIISSTCYISFKLPKRERHYVSDTIKSLEIYFIKTSRMMTNICRQIYVDKFCDFFFIHIFIYNSKRVDISKIIMKITFLPYEFSLVDKDIYYLPFLQLKDHLLYLRRKRKKKTTNFE